MLLYAALVVASGIEWKEADTLVVRGQAHGFANDLDTRYDRLPVAGTDNPRLKKMIQLGAGHYVDFTSDSPSLYLEGTFSNSGAFNYYSSPSVAVGFDLFRWDPSASRWRWAGAGSQVNFDPFNYTLATSLGTTLQKYRIHFPVYGAVGRLLVGHDNGTSLSAVPPAYPGGAIVWGGTSICHGTGVMIPGNVFTNQLRMMLGIEVHNLCFAGSGTYDPNVAKHFVQIKPPPALFVLDNIRNSAALEGLVEVVRIIRQAHPNTPILFPDGPLDRRHWAKSPEIQHNLRKREKILRSLLTELSSEGVEKLYHVSGDHYYNLSIDPQQLQDYTADRSHPSDVGNVAYARFHASHIPGILAGKPSNVYPTLDIEPIVLPEEPTSREAKALGLAPLPGDMVWHDAIPHIKGLPYGQQKLDGRAVLSRLTEGVEGLPRGVSAGMRFSSGGKVYFNTTTSIVGLSYKLASDVSPRATIPSTLMASCDLYKWDEEHKMYRGIMVSRYYGSAGTERSMVVEDEATPGSYLMYLPIFATPMSLSIGADNGAELHFEEARYVTDTSIVWYGGGFAQGAGAHRPGNTMLNILSRTLGIHIANLGLYLSAHLESEVVPLVTSAANEKTALFVVDVVQDATVDEIKERLGTFIRGIREQFAQTPILLVAGHRHGAEWYVGSGHEWALRRAALQAEYERLLPKYGNLHIFMNENEEMYVGDDHGTHSNGVDPTDLGHLKAAVFYSEYLKRFLTHETSDTPGTQVPATDASADISPTGVPPTGAPVTDVPVTTAPERDATVAPANSTVQSVEELAMQEEVLVVSEGTVLSEYTSTRNLLIILTVLLVVVFRYRPRRQLE